MKREELEQDALELYDELTPEGQRLFFQKLILCIPTELFETIAKASSVDEVR